MSGKESTRINKEVARANNNMHKTKVRLAVTEAYWRAFENTINGTKE